MNHRSRELFESGLGAFLFSYEGVVIYHQDLSTPAIAAIHWERSADATIKLTVYFRMFADTFFAHEVLLTEVILSESKDAITACAEVIIENYMRSTWEKCDWMFMSAENMRTEGIMPKI